MDAGGQPACTPAPTLAPPDRYDDGIALALTALLGRRRLIQAAAGGASALLLAACGQSSNGATSASGSGSSSATALSTTRASRSAPSSSLASTSAASTSAAGSGTLSTATAVSSSASTTGTVASSAAQGAATSAATAAGSGQGQWVYVFNVGSQDVSVIDAASHKVLATKPLGAAVRWLSNEQRYWDGQHIWTYDFPNNKLQAVVIDPKAVAVVKSIDTGTTGPGHSLMLTPDKKTAMLNAGGSDVINVIDVASGQLTDKIETGKFP